MPLKLSLRTLQLSNPQTTAKALSRCQLRALYSQEIIMVRKWMRGKVRHYIILLLMKNTTCLSRYGMTS